MLLDPWQQEALDHKGDLLLCTGRRVGKTLIVAIKAIERMQEKKTQIIVASLTEDQAILIIQFALNYAKEKYPNLISSGKDKPQLKIITFKNGSKMIARPVGTAGDSLRGFEGGVLIVDEAARMPIFFWMAATPILLTTQGELWLCSTPHGRVGYFWERFNEAYNLHEQDARFKVIYTSTEKVINERPISESWTAEQREGALNILSYEKKEMSTLAYGQEYLGLFLEDLQQFFPDELIKKCMTRKRKEEISVLSNNFLGVDVARQGEDQSSFEIFELTDDNKLIQLDNQITTKTYLYETSNHIINLHRQYNFKRIYLDAEGIGVGVYDNLLENETTRRVIIPILNSKRLLDREGKLTTRILKQALYHNLLRLMETGKVEFLDDAAIFHSLKSIQYEYTTDKKGVPFQKIFGNDSHICEGIIRACWSIKEKNLKLWICSI